MRYFFVADTRVIDAAGFRVGILNEITAQQAVVEILLVDLFRRRKHENVRRADPIEGSDPDLVLR